VVCIFTVLSFGVYGFMYACAAAAVAESIKSEKFVFIFTVNTFFALSISTIMQSVAG